MKKGFTLIELLAVIVILAIIALIATPIILGIIADARNEAKLRSAELYLTAVEQAILRKKMTKTDFNPESCDVNDGVVTCEGETLQVDVDGEVPERGTIGLSNGKTTEVTLTYTDASFKTDENNNLVITNKNNGEVDSDPEPTPASCFEVDGVDSEVSILEYDTECGTDVIIPKTIEGKLVTSIESYAFSNNGLTSVVIPNSVTSIGEEAFVDNALTSIIIPDSVTYIGAGAFSNNRLESVVIGNGVKTIGGSAFSFNNDTLTSVILGNSVETIGGSAFSDNENLTSIIIPSSVTSIGFCAFCDTGLGTVIIQKQEGSIDLSDLIFPGSEDIIWEPIE